MADLVVKISGDMQDFTDMLKAASEETEALNEKFKTMGEYSAVTLAALTAEAYEAVKAFGQEEIAVNKLNQQLQQQGIYSAELSASYKEQADALERKTGISNEAIISGQTMLQGMIGQVKITPQLTAAAADLSTKTGSLSSAFELIGKAATGNVSMLKRYGIEMADQHDRAANLEEITRLLNAQLGGQAEAAAQGLGGISKLKVAFDDVQKAIGERLAPAVESIIGSFTTLFNYIKDSPQLTNFIVAMGLAAGAVAAIGTAVSVAGVAFLSLKAALLACQIATTATSIAVRGLVGATGIGLLIIAATEIYLNWNSIWPRMYAVFKTFADQVGAIAMNFGKLLFSAMAGDVDGVKEAWAGLKTSLSATMKEYNTIVDKSLADQTESVKKAAVEQTAAQKAAGDAHEAELRRREGLEAQIEANKFKTQLDQLNKYNADYVKLEQQETQILEALANEQNKKIWDALAVQLANVRFLKQQASAEAIQQQTDFNDTILANSKEFMALDAKQQGEFIAKEGAALRDSLLTEQTVKQKIAKDSIAADVKNQNQSLVDQAKYGAAYAAINKAMHTAEFVGAASALDDMAVMVNSKNDTLKGIGKTAAVANIGIKTAESAMNIFAGWSTIPFVGYALGIVGAAAAIAYGAEQTSEVLAMADGGLVTGGTPGVDSVPIMGMPGELMVPKQNFDEVVSAVASARAGAQGQDGGQGFGNIVLTLKGDITKFIETQIVQRQNLNISVLKAT